MDKRIVKAEDTRRFGGPLSAVYQHAKRPRNRLPPPVCARRRKICRIHENVVRLRVQTHGLGAQFRLHLLYLTELVRRVFVEDVHKTFARRDVDRKSTRLNSSHGYISYAVFCLKKKKV